VGTESDGFPDEPTFNLAALAGQEQLQERIRQLENERAGKVLVDPEDLRAVLRMACDSPEGMPVLPDEDAALLRLTAAVRTGQ